MMVDASSFLLATTAVQLSWHTQLYVTSKGHPVPQRRPQPALGVTTMYCRLFVTYCIEFRHTTASERERQRHGQRAACGLCVDTLMMLWSVVCGHALEDGRNARKRGVRPQETFAAGG